MVAVKLGSWLNAKRQNGNEMTEAGVAARVRSLSSLACVADWLAMYLLA